MKTERSFRSELNHCRQDLTSRKLRICSGGQRHIGFDSKALLPLEVRLPVLKQDHDHLPRQGEKVQYTPPGVESVCRGQITELTRYGAMEAPVICSRTRRVWQEPAKADEMMREGGEIA